MTLLRRVARRVVRRVAQWMFAPVVLLAPACSKSNSQPPPQPQADAGGDAGVGDPLDYLQVAPSCALASCTELLTCEPKGFVCPALAPYELLPHAASCGAYSAHSEAFPKIVGKCVASAPIADAAKYDGVDPDDPSTVILPTGQRVKPAGKTSVFGDFKGQFPANVVEVPGTDLVVVVDSGIQEQSVRLIDTTLIGGISAGPGGVGDPVVGREKFIGDTGVNYGAVVVPDTPIRLYVSGSANSVIYAFTIDATAKKLLRDAGNDISIARASGKPKGGGLGGGYRLSGMTASPDHRRLVVGSGNSPGGSTPLFVIDIDKTSASFKQVVKSFELVGREIFSVSFHPADSEARYVFASIWDGARIDVIDTMSGSPTGAIRSIPTGKNPESFTPLGTRYLAVIASDEDAISVIDLLPKGASEVLRVPLVDASFGDGTSARRHGLGASGSAFDPVTKRLYVSLGALNAVAAFDTLEPIAPDAGPPMIVPAGMIPTDWWPTALTVRKDNSVVIISGKGRGTGANPTPFKPGEGNITDLMRGSIQLVPPPDAASLATGKDTVAIATDASKLKGAPAVDCAGAAYDFPIPRTNQEGPSKLIKHVVFVVKENKTFDSIFGDLGTVNGDAKLVMAPGQMDQIFANQRKLAQSFTNFDNYYTSAEQSIQGHVWTAFGRTTDFIERTWLVTWGRGYRGAATDGIIPVGRPLEGSIFDWMQREGILFDNMAEPVGAADDDGKLPKNCCYDAKYPGLLYAMDKPDTEKSCYMVARARVTCDLKPFTYAGQPNDHTAGGSAGRPTPQTYIAVGDEAIGLLVDGLSKSPIWGDTLVIVTEDDPQDGGDHVDAHRTPLYMASPFIKRGYVSKTHLDTSSIHKLIAHIFGKPYLNESVARAALPLDAFTSTPDYAPWTHLPRSLPLACNAAGTWAATAAAMSNWDFSRPDEAPGLARQVWEIMHQGANAMGDATGHARGDARGEKLPFRGSDDDD
ncbi:MAG: hypothetical protein NVSMB1_06200 [Polyangiales bacterium]